jgi:hypothetical protein
MKLTDFLIDAGRPIIYYPGLTRITGSTNATILLCQFLQFREKENNKEEWFCKTADEILCETGLSRNQQQTARIKLKNLGILEEKFMGNPRRLYFRLNLKD